MSLRATAAVPLILSLAAVLTYHHHEQTMRPRLHDRIAKHDAILSGAADAPYRFRLLVPWVMEHASQRLAGPGGDRPAAFLTSYTAFVFAALAGALMALFAYLRRWFEPGAALVGVLFVAATMTVPLRDHFFQPWSFAELALFCTGLLLIERRRPVLLLVVVAIAALNRETALFIVVAHAAAHIRGRGSRAWIGWTAAYLAVWGAAFVWLRHHAGPGPGPTIAEIWQHNTAGPRLRHAAINITLFLGAMWAFAALGVRTAPPFAKRMLLVVPPYLLAVGLFGVWHEVRLLMPLYPILLPPALAYLFRTAPSPAQAASTSAGTNTNSGL